jgi:hypothetical protein
MLSEYAKNSTNEDLFVQWDAYIRQVRHEDEAEATSDAAIHPSHREGFDPTADATLPEVNLPVHA